MTDNLFALVVCVVLVIRQEKLLVPSGDTEILPGDLLVIAAKAFENRANLTLQEVKMTAKHRFCGKALREVETPPGTLVVMVRRGRQTIIPDGSTRLQASYW